MALEGAMEEEVSGVGEGCLTQDPTHRTSSIPTDLYILPRPCLAPLSFPSEKSDGGTKEKALLN
ncbi:hypothetical protein NC651_039331 [Populus alba x Populus x berolinensis]|nr:hypothetical protein NC651_039331 [Populus alba x Populus x berolinensis]